MCQTLNKVWLIFTAILFFIPNCTKNETDNIIAKVGTLSVSVEEFKDAYQFNPHLSSVKNPQTAKQIVLNSLIAEKLIARQGYEKNSQNQSRIKLQSDQYEREAIIEKFWQDKIFNEITISENELLEAYYKSKKEKIVQFINYKNKRQAYNDYQKIKEGLSFEEIAGLNGLPLNCIPADTIKMFGKLPNLEERVFSMKINEISAPVKEGKFYFIVKLTGERENIFTSEMDFAQQRKKIQKELKKSKSFKNFQNYVNTHLSSDNFKLDKNQFKELVRKTENSLFEKAELNQSKSNEYLLDIYFDNAKNNRDQFLKQPVVKFSNGTTWDTGTLLQRIAVSPYTVDKRSKGAFRHSMIAAAKNILNDELLVNHAGKLKLHKTAYVKRQKQMWRDYLVYKKQLAEIIRQADKNSNENINKNALYTKAVEDYLLDKISQCKTEINYEALDTLNLIKTDMVVLKRHFPGRTISPVIKPFTGMPKWAAKIMDRN